MKPETKELIIEIASSIVGILIAVVVGLATAAAIHNYQFNNL